MRHLTVSILVTLAVLLGSAGEGFALPECPGSPTNSKKVWTSWNNCEGTLTLPSGTKYVGEWKDGLPNGQGTLTSADGGKYVGEFKDFEMHGQGTFTFASGGKYVGEWKDSKIHGQGTYTYGSKSKLAGDKYVGEYKDDKKHGQGTYTHADGRVKEGIFENDEFKYAKKVTPTVTAKKSAKKSSGSNQSSLPECPGSPTNSKKVWTSWNNCEGTDTSPDGKSGYVGEFKGGKYHGQGTFTYADGDKYVGEWKDGNKHGQGTYTFAKSGNKYVGEYKDGKYHGQGTYAYADGEVTEGIFENGNFKYAKKP